jgi:GNAT superfamily N-acetyltransferase
MSELEITDNPTAEEIEAVRGPLAAFNAAAAGLPNRRPLAVLLRDSEGKAVGGLIGWTFWAWLYVDLLFIPEAQRRAGLGSDILRTAEAEARRRGCANAYLFTLGFQAKPFYERHGYREFGRLDGFPGAFAAHFMTKRL